MKIIKSRDIQNIKPGDIIYHNCAYVLKVLEVSEYSVKVIEVEYDDESQDYITVGKPESYDYRDLIGDTVE